MVRLGKQLLVLRDLGRVDLVKSFDFVDGCFERRLDDLKLLKTFLELLDFEIESFFGDGLFSGHFVRIYY